jgi:hypothetical protein
MTIERRKYIRFSTKKKNFAALRSGFDKVGRVLDLSINGLAFTYILEEDIIAEPFQVDIFQSENGLYLSNIPCRVVYDIPNTKKRYDSLIQPRRCGLCFGRLSEKEYYNLLKYMREATCLVSV